MKRSFGKHLVVCVAVVAICVCGLSTASASLTYSFDNITNNNLGDAAAGEAQLSVTVSDAFGGMNGASTQALFTFNNSNANGAAAMSITDVYFDDFDDDGTLFEIAQIYNGAGVDFSQGANPGDLPGGNNASPPFQTTAGFSADSNPPAQPNGVNPGETLGILFDLIDGKTLADTYAALALGGVDGGLRIGIHVQGFSGGGSESFVTKGGLPIPEPASVVVWSLLGGLPGLFVYFSKRKRAA